MKFVDNALELRSFVDEAGVLTEPVTVNAAKNLADLQFLNSFENLTLADGVSLSEVNNVDSFKGLAVGASCSISGLTSMQSLDDLVGGENLSLSGLNYMKSFGAPILRTGTRISWLDQLIDIDFRQVMWPKDVALEGVSRDVAKSMPSALNDRVSLTVQ